MNQYKRDKGPDIIQQQWMCYILHKLDIQKLSFNLCETKNWSWMKIGSWLFVDSHANLQNEMLGQVPRNEIYVDYIVRILRKYRRVRVRSFRTRVLLEDPTQMWQLLVKRMNDDYTLNENAKLGAGC